MSLSRHGLLRRKIHRWLVFASTLRNRWIRRSRLINAKRCDIPSHNVFLYVIVSRRFGYKYRRKSIGCSFGTVPCSPSKLLLEIIDGASYQRFVSLVSQIFLFRSFVFNAYLSIANQMYFKTIVYFKGKDGENSIREIPFSLYYNNIRYMSVMFSFIIFFYYIFNNEKRLSWTCPVIFLYVISKMLFII